MRLFLMMILLFEVQLQLCAQVPDITLESVLESAPANADPEEVIQQVQYYKDHPLDLNKADMAELCVPGMFSQLQATRLLQHRRKYGVLIAFEELQAIPEMDAVTLHRVRSYCCTGSIINPQVWKPSVIFNEGRHQLLMRIRTDLPLVKNAAYLGNMLSQNFSWRFNAGNYFDIGFNGDKDAGERNIRRGVVPGMDAWNYHVFARPGGWLKAIALGDYQINCGQGLVAWTGFAGSKGPDVVNVRKLGTVLRPYSAFGEYNLYRGAALSIGNDRSHLTFWISNKRLDSNREGNAFRTIRSDGYHRTPNELVPSANLKRLITGMHYRYKGKQFNHELTFQLYRYNAIKVKGNNSYQRYEPEGVLFWNTSYSYSFLQRNYSMSGEFAVNEKGVPAVLNTLLVSADPKLAFALVHRYLPPRYYSFSADPFRENSQAQNEQGLYAGFQYQFRPRIRISSYVDYFVFPWLKYRVDQPSSGREWLCQLNWTPARYNELYLRFRRRIKEENVNSSGEGLRLLEQMAQDNVRADARLKLSTAVFLQSRVEWTRLWNEFSVKSDGWLMFQELDFKPLGKPWSLTFRYSVYTTSDYDTRIYAFEQELLGSFSLPAYYGAGTSSYILLRYRILKGLDTWVRIATSKPVGKDAVRIWSPGLQVRWIFGK
jgi:hypothetical protein